MAHFPRVSFNCSVLLADIKDRCLCPRNKNRLTFEERTLWVIEDLSQRDFSCSHTPSHFRASMFKDEVIRNISGATS